MRSQLAQSPRDRALVSVLAYSGPRPEEALRLRWRDVGDEAIHYDGRKTRKPRWTPLLTHLAADLRECVPLTEIARHCGTSLAMLDKHYARVIANFDERRIPADEQIAKARSDLASSVQR